ncbi:MAG: hypothetical protein NVV63_12545 [Opitutus sp.]|nr:hypothetical protein [Opitutus sp.]
MSSQPSDQVDPVFDQLEGCVFKNTSEPFQKRMEERVLKSLFVNGRSLKLDKIAALPVALLVCSGSEIDVISAETTRPGVNEGLSISSSPRQVTCAENYRSTSIKQAPPTSSSPTYNAIVSASREVI